MNEEGALSRIATRALGAVLAGWLIVYAIFRLGGDSPSSAAWVSLGIGAVIGLVIFGVILLLQRRRAGAQPAADAEEDMSAAAAEQFDAVRIVGGILGGFAVIVAIMALASAADWFSADGDRPWTPAVLALWYILAAGWSADQALRNWQGDAQDLDSMPLVATLTAVLAALGYARGIIEPGQIIVIVASIVAGAASGFMVWRLGGSRGIPLTAAGVVVVSVIAAALAFV